MCFCNSKLDDIVLHQDGNKTNTIHLSAHDIIR